MATYTNDSKNSATFSNDSIYQYLLKSDLGLVLKSDGGSIIIESPTGSEIFSKDSKTSATFTNESRN